MKLIYTFLFLSSLTTGIFAQPIIDQDNFISAEDVFEYVRLLEPGSELIDVIPEGGENLTWDFSTLPAEGVELSNSYYPLDSTPEIFRLFFGNPILAGENFSTHALELTTLDFELPLPLEIEEAYQFYRSDDEGYFITGNAAEVAGLPLVSAYDTLDVVFSFPLTFGDKDTNSFYFLTDIPSIGSVGQSGLRSTNADAWGSLTLPSGSYDVLRVRTELDLIDTIYIGFTETGTLIERPRQVNYTWISPEVGGVVAEAVFVEDALISFRYLVNQSALFSIEISDANFNIFPNPASQSFEISVPLNFFGSYKIIGLTGREMITGQLSRTDAIDISGLSEGIYLISLYGSEMVLTKRLIVSR